MAGCLVHRRSQWRVLNTLALLKREVEKWNAWQREHGEIWPEFSGANLYAATLREADLDGADLRGANLNSTSLNGADFRGTDLRDAIGLTQAQLDEAIIDSDTQLPSVDE